MKKYAIIIFSSLLMPLLVVAAPATADLDGVIGVVATLVKSATPVVVALALLYFFWGLAQFIFKSGEGAAQEEGKNKMVWGIIALFVMVSVWGIVKLIQNTLIGSANIPTTISPPKTS